MGGSLATRCVDIPLSTRAGVMEVAVMVACWVNRTRVPNRMLLFPREHCPSEEQQAQTLAGQETIKVEEITQAEKGRLKLAKRCTQCKHVFRAGNNHASRRKHRVVALSEDQEAQLLAMLRCEAVEEEVAVRGQHKSKGEGPRKRHRVVTLSAEQQAQLLAMLRCEAVEEDVAVREQHKPKGDGEYRFDFGKHKGQKLSIVAAKYPSYLPVLMSMGIVDSNPELKKALQEANLWDRTQQQGKRRKVDSPMKTKAAQTLEDELHPEEMSVGTCSLPEEPYCHRWQQ